MINKPQKRPIPDSYWVSIGKPPTAGLLAGEYPGAKDDTEARHKVGRLRDAGVTLFVDLTEAGEYGLKPYTPFVEEINAERGLSAQHLRLSIPDMGIPSLSRMAHILDAIDAAVSEGHTVYVHCYGGIGRTGTVVGCYLVRHGFSGEEALAQIAQWRAGTPDGGRQSPETFAQRQMVLNWQETP